MPDTSGDSVDTGGRRVRPGSPIARRDQLLHEQSGHRELVLDEHMYRVKLDYGHPSMRLQVFTAAGLRPVAVVTQYLDEGSLFNSAENLIGHVWREHFPTEPVPPLWVQRQLMHHWHDHEWAPYNLVLADVGDDFTVTGPDWPPLTQDQVDTLVGQPVDPERGDYRPPPPAPVYRQRFVPARVATMPRTQPFRQECMTSTDGEPRRRPPWWTDAWRRHRRHQVDRSCCWYHCGDWVVVNKLALRFLADLPDPEADEDEIVGQVLDAARRENLDPWTVEALTSLFIDPIVLQKDAGGRTPAFTNGQHRVQAMRDVGVARTVIAVDVAVS